MSFCCELLSDLLPLALSHNICIFLCFFIRVVNCFQIYYLWHWATTNWGFCIHLSCCELLSDLLPLALSHNSACKSFRVNWVVNCFQIYYLWHWATTRWCLYRRSHRLWIAFRFTTFGIEPQRQPHPLPWRICCELLSDLLPLALSHNHWARFVLLPMVVNCFQIYYLWHWATTCRDIAKKWRWLWIAFRFTTFGIEPQRESGI